MFQLAHHIIALANDRNIPVTPWRLQLIMYFTFKIALQKKLYNLKQFKQMYTPSNQKFYVWRYGPTIPLIHVWYKGFGEGVISEPDHRILYFDRLNPIIKNLFKKSFTELNNQAHQEKFYLNHKDQISAFRSPVAYNLSNIATGL